MKTKEYIQEIHITDDMMARINELISHYPSGRQKSAILPVLHVVQEGHKNWLGIPLMNRVAEILQITPIEVYEVVTFYNKFNQKPVGKYLLEFCQTSCCGLRKGDEILDYTCRKLGIEVDETTPDGLFTIRTVECIGACGEAPVLQLGEHNYVQLTEKKIDTLIEDCRQGKVKPDGSYE